MKLFTLGLRVVSCWLLAILLMPFAGHSQAWQWAQAVSSTGTAGYGNDATIAALVPDAATGTTVVTGSFSGTLVLGPTTLSSPNRYDVFVARLNASGQWTQAFQAGGLGNKEVSALALDGAGGVIIAGSFSGDVGSSGFATAAGFGSLTLQSTGRFNLFVARLSAAGVWTQAVRDDSPASTTYSAPQLRGLTLDGAGNVVVVGSFDAPAATFGPITLTGMGGENGFVARLSPAGQWVQAVAIVGGPAARFYAVVDAVVMDQAGNAVVGGGFGADRGPGCTVAFGPFTLTSAGNTDAFVARLNPAGQWVQAVQAGGYNLDYVTALALDGAGDVVVAGNISGFPGDQVGFGSIPLTCAGSVDVFVARLNSAGQWTQAVAAGGSTKDVLNSLVVDGAGNAVVAGAFGSEISVIPSGGSISFGTQALRSAGCIDMFVARLSRTGQWTQNIAAGGITDDWATAVALDGAGNATIAGSVFNANFGPITLGSTIRTSFVAQLTSLTPTAARAATPAEVFTLSPNPATAQVRLSWPETSATARPVQVLDGLGRAVRRLELPARATSAALDVQGLAPGFYLVRCGAATGRLVVE